MICSSETLSSLDEALAVIYRFESTGSTGEPVRASQRVWLTNRNHCGSEACVEARYEERITALCSEGQRATGAAIGANACSSVLLRIAERELAALERVQDNALQSSDDPATMRSLIAAERQAWKAYRDARCALQGFEEGGIPAWKAAFAGFCAIEETHARARALSR